MEQSDDLGLANQPLAAVLKQRIQQGKKYAKIGTFTLLSAESELGQESKEYALNSTVNAQSLRLPCHIHQLTGDAFYQMVSQKQDQTILLHGVSGSGKSINRLAISKQLTILANNGKKKSKVLSGALKMESALEAFGSYKTALSDYSSGFGRYTEYQFSTTGRMVGIKILDYGFNTARVFNGSTLSDGERPFQIFYQLLAGCTDEERQALFLNDPTSFVYTKGINNTASQALSRTNTLTRKLTLSRSKSITKKTTAQSSPDATPTTQDGLKFLALKDQLKSLGIGKRTQQQIYKILAAILHLGNLIFQDDENSPQEPCLIKNPEVLVIAAGLLGLSTESLSNAILYKSKTVGKDTFSTFLKQDSALENRDFLASTLYTQIFTWIIEHLNNRLCKNDSEFDNSISTLDFCWYRQDFCALSSFVSNYAIERLIQYTQSQSFDTPSLIFQSQSLDFKNPAYLDNQLAVDVFDGTSRVPGIWGLIETNRSIQVKIETTPAREILNILDSAMKPNPSFIKSLDCQTSKPAFGIKHFRGDVNVEYDLTSFLEEDCGLADFKALFGTSTSDNETFLMTIFGKKNGVESVKGGT
jgi:chitin synthase